MNHSTGKPTKYEAERIDAMLRLGCCCCAQLALWNVAECQHIVEGNRRLGHWYTLPICPGHHRGVWTSDQVEVIPPLALVAISDGSKRFTKIYGTQRDLWMKVQQRLRLPAIWPLTKILPRRGDNHGNPMVEAAVTLVGTVPDGPEGACVGAQAAGEGS